MSRTDALSVDAAAIRFTKSQSKPSKMVRPFRADVRRYHDRKTKTAILASQTGDHKDDRNIVGTIKKRERQCRCHLHRTRTGPQKGRKQSNAPPPERLPSRRTRKMHGCALRPSTKSTDIGPRPPSCRWLRKRSQKKGARKKDPEIIWPEPKPLPNGLPKVDAFAYEFLPDRLAPWALDVSNRLQSPPDYVAVAVMTALGSVIGRRVGIKPQAKTDWTEIPNLWGMFIGRPGALKSPAMTEALKHIHHLEAEAAKENEIAQQAYAAGLDAYDLRKKVRVSLEKEALKKSKDGAKVEINFDLGEEPKEPLPVRYRTNNSTYEAVGELLIANPSGILVERDELVSLLRHLDRDEQTVARGFYLSGWSGSQPYTFDRILRGHLHIEAVCLSVLGNTQPSRIAEYVLRANADGGGGDGLLQRFRLDGLA